MRCVQKARTSLMLALGFLLLTASAAGVLAGCDDGSGPSVIVVDDDGGLPDGDGMDGGARDAGPEGDSAVPSDAGAGDGADGGMDEGDAAGPDDEEDTGGDHFDSDVGDLSDGGADRDTGNGDQFEWEPIIIDGCTPSGELGEPLQVPVEMLFDEDWEGTAHDFWHRPFPDDSRLVKDGGERAAGAPVQGFPNPDNNPMVEALVTIAADEFVGWSRNGTIYLTFSGPLAPETLPADMEATIGSDATVYLQDVDPDSPDFGTKIPVQLRYYPEQSLFMPAHTIAIKPAWGVVLRDRGVYGAVVTTGVGDGWCRALRSAEGRPALEARVGEWLSVEADSVAGVAIFTTQDVVGPVRKIRESVRSLERPSMEVAGVLEVPGVRRTLTGTISFPVYQSGQPPYLLVGGSIQVDSEGMPIVQRQEDVQVSISVPDPDGENGLTQPESGWPVIIYGHGTGGDSLSCTRDGVADGLAKEGFAVVCYDQVLHGTRDPSGSDPANTFFNFLNLAAGRDNVRQGAADGFLLAHFLGDGDLPLVDSPSLEESYPAEQFKMDSSSLYVLGHSQGGITGIPFASVEESVAAAVYNGTGGGLMIAILERKDPVDIKVALEQLMGFPSGHELDYFHPVLTLVQTLLDPADSINYATVVADGGRVNGQHVLLFEGVLDPVTPALSVESLAVAFGLEQVMPVERSIETMGLLGKEPVEAPVQGNLDGGARTGGLVQYGDQGHFSIFRPLECDANQVMGRFFKFALTAPDGVPVIERFDDK